MLLLAFLALPIQAAAVDVTPCLADYPLYARLQADAQFGLGFRRYFRWLAGFGDPDPVYVQGFIDRDARTLEAQAVIFHEAVEFLGWLELGHRLADMMSLDYYRAHYPAVYPIAHARAVREELALVKHFARGRGFPDLPEIAFALTMPLLEQRPGVTVAHLMKRLGYPGLAAVQAQARQLTRAQVDTATHVYSDGGYAYRDREAVVEAVMRFLAPNANRQ